MEIKVSIELRSDVGYGSYETVAKSEHQQIVVSDEFDARKFKRELASAVEDAHSQVERQLRELAAQKSDDA